MNMSRYTFLINVNLRVTFRSVLVYNLVDNLPNFVVSFRTIYLQEVAAKNSASRATIIETHTAGTTSFAQVRNEMVYLCFEKNVLC